MKKIIKKIRLKKDTPDHKAGELFVLMSNNGIYEIDAGEDDPSVFYGGDIKNFDEWFEEVEDTKGGWKPEFGERYYYLGSDGCVYHNQWENDSFDKARLKFGLIFKTERATERWRDYLKAITIVRQDEGVLTPEQVDELIKDEGLAYYVGYMGNRGNGEVLCGCTMSFDECWMPVGVILFDSEAHADSSLSKHPDEWKIIVNYDWSRE